MVRESQTWWGYQGHIHPVYTYIYMFWLWRFYTLIYHHIYTLFRTDLILVILSYYDVLLSYVIIANDIIRDKHRLFCHSLLLSACLCQTILSSFILSCSKQRIFLWWINEQWVFVPIPFNHFTIINDNKSCAMGKGGKGGLLLLGFWEIVCIPLTLCHTRLSAFV